MNMTITVSKDLIEALQHQGQCDEDGTNCIVSREAVDTAIGIMQAVPQLEHERDKALEDYEQAMHRVSQLEALPLLQFTSVDDGLPDTDGEYLCQFDDGKIETYSYRIDDGGFHGDDVEPGFRVLRWSDPTSLPSAGSCLAHVRAEAIEDALKGQERYFVDTVDGEWEPSILVKDLEYKADAYMRAIPNQWLLNERAKLEKIVNDMEATPAAVPEGFPACAPPKHMSPMISTGLT